MGDVEMCASLIVIDAELPHRDLRRMLTLTL